MRKIQLVNEEYYHIFNRGTDKRDIFMCPNDYERFYESIVLLNNEKDGLMQTWRDLKRVSPRAKLSDIPELSSGRGFLVEIVAYCFNPNHFHFILKQLAEKGIERFMHKLATSHTNYFNKKYDRSGSLFQGPFKSIHIDSNEYLLYLSVYVSCNSELHGIAPSESHEWCSYPEYLGKNGNLCQKEIILGQFGSLKEYRKFSKLNVKEMKNKKEMGESLLE